MDRLRQDLRHTLRALRRNIGFTVVIVLTLGIGIGVNTAVFSLVHSTLLAPLPYRDSDRLAMVWTTIPARGMDEATSAYANILDWKAHNHVFEDFATFDPTSLTLTDGAWPEQVSTGRVSANLFTVLGVAPAIGRAFSLEEERQHARVVVLSREFWQRRFDASANPIGETVEIGGSTFQIVGVMPADFDFPDSSTQLWLPQTLFTDWDATVAQRGTGAWRVIGRLKPGVSLERARAEMAGIAERLERRHPEVNAGLGVNVIPLYEQVTGQTYRLTVWMLFGAVGFVLLIACANAAHLVLARGLDRGQEFAVRLALGATAPRLIRQAVTENLVLSAVAGVAGLVFASAGLRLLIGLAPAGLPRLDEIGIDGPVLIYAVAVSLCAGVLFGTVPAASLVRGSPFGALREGRTFGRVGRAHHVRRVLIALQFMLAIVLVFGANLLIRSLLEARGVDPGFVPENTLIANLSVEAESRRVDFYERVLHEVGAIPGVGAVGLIEDLFISGAPNRAITVEGGAVENSLFEEVRIDAIAGEFFEAVGVPLRAGRAFSTSDGAEAAPVAVINETMARRFWPGESPVGKRFRPGGPESSAPWIEVVGVVGDMRRQGLERESISQVFRPYAQEPSRNMNLLVRSDRPFAALTPMVRARIADIDRTVPLYRVTTVTQALDGYLVQRRFHSFLLAVFSALALVLAALGIYGLVSYSVARRSHEMAVRIALGASSEGLASMIVWQGLSLAIPGVAAGIVGAVWIADSVSALLFGVAATDMTSILVASAILLATALCASYIPARRAASVDPMVAIRCR